MTDFHSKTTISVWAEYKTEDGRSYWYNSKTAQSVWEKPKEEETKPPRKNLFSFFPILEFGKQIKSSSFLFF
jgi:hypothetical protein